VSSEPSQASVEVEDTVFVLDTSHKRIKLPNFKKKNVEE
jgi:hypothetical protein